MLFSLSTTNALFVYLPSPAEELYFGSMESGEKKTLIVLTNVTKNIVAFKVNKQTNKQFKAIINYESEIMASDLEHILMERVEVRH